MAHTTNNNNINIYSSTRHLATYLLYKVYITAYSVHTLYTVMYSVQCTNYIVHRTNVCGKATCNRK